MRTELGVSPAEALLESGRFSLEPQTPAEVWAALEEVPLVHSALGRAGLGVLGEDVDTFFHLIDNPRKVSDAASKKAYIAAEMWWLVYADESLAAKNGHFRYNPFNRPQPQTETLVVAEDSRELAVVHNFAAELGENDKDSIQTAFNWFHRYTRGQFEGFVDTMIIGNHLSYFYDDQISKDGVGQYGQILGLQHSAPRLKTSFSRTTFDDKTSLPEAGRYEPLSGHGISLSDLVITHEFAHAIGGQYGRVFKMFKDLAGWEDHQYKIGRRGRRKVSHICGQGNNYDQLSPTEYGATDPIEDFAESMVFFRFAPNLLGDERRAFFAKMPNLMRLPNRGEVPPAVIHQAEQPLYPHHRIPNRIVARFMPSRTQLLNAVMGDIDKLTDMIAISRKLDLISEFDPDLD